MMRVRFGFGIALSLLVIIAKAKACDCTEHKPCDSFHSRGNLFTGEVFSVMAASNRGEHRGQAFREAENVYSVRVIESLEGSARPGQTVSVITPSGGSSCGYTFHLNAKYLIDADEQTGKYFTSLCSWTGLQEDRVEVLREVRARLAGRRPPDLSGTVGMDDLLALTTTSAPLSGIKVIVRGLKTNAQFQTVSDKDGYYSFDKVPADSYSISLEGLPNGFSVGASNLEPYLRHNTPPIDVYGGKPASATCHLELDVLPSGRISGHLHASAKVLSDRTISAYRVDPRTGRKRVIRVDFPKQDGGFALGFLPDGHYEIRVEYLAKRGTLMRKQLDIIGGKQMTDVELFSN